MNTAIDNNTAINNFDTLRLDIIDGNIQLTIEYSSDDWDDIRSDRTQDVIAKLEAALKKLQTAFCLGRHPVRYSETIRHTPLCDLPYIVVTIILATKDEINSEANELLARLSSPKNLLNIPSEEVAQLRHKLRKSKKYLYTSHTPKHRWRL